jgi:hypothetical protein
MQEWTVRNDRRANGRSDVREIIGYAGEITLRDCIDFMSIIANRLLSVAGLACAE